MYSKITAAVIALCFFCSCKDQETPKVEKTVNDQEIAESPKTAPDFELSEVMKPVFFDYTSTGCPGCGSWGAPTPVSYTHLTLPTTPYV